MFPVNLACQWAWAKVQQEAEAAESHRPESKGNDDQEDRVDGLKQLDTVGKVGNCSCFMLFPTNQMMVRTGQRLYSDSNTAKILCPAGWYFWRSAMS